MVESPMNAVDALILDLLEWLAARERTYAETMEAWRTSCPRLPVWEEATTRGLVAREHADGRATVRVTAAGIALLEQHRPLLTANPAARCTGMAV
jgi:D-3-phosphoglycerate dehydrogenase / 2-oxoglutarate reductase